MKVLAINGSPEPMGNTSNILNEVQDMFERNGIEMEIVHIYDYRLTNCNVCFTCEIRGDGRCYQNFLERAMLVFQNSGVPLTGKVGGAFSVCRHDGGSLVYNQLVDFLLRNGLLVAGSYPLPIVRAWHSPDYEDDEYGMKGIRAMVGRMTDALVRLEGTEPSMDM